MFLSILLCELEWYSNKKIMHKPVSVIRAYKHVWTVLQIY